jgi:hypothetical protein
MILWSAHLLHVSLPVSRGFSSCSYSSLQAILFDLLSGKWLSLSSQLPSETSIYGSYSSSSLGYGHLLSFSGGLSSDTFSIPLSDNCHHHLSLGILILWSCSFASSISSSFSYRISTSSFSSREFSLLSRSSHLTLSSILFSLGFFSLFNFSAYLFFMSLRLFFS